MSPTSTHTDNQERLKSALIALQRMRGKLEALEQARDEPIAVIGIGCRFPGGADSPASFWELLCDGVDAIREVPRDRWDVDAYYDPDPDAPGKSYSRWGGFLDRVDLFDPQFFGIAPREARRMDPQHRLLLEVAWEALENAGQAPSGLAGSQTGVFVGITSTSYAHLQSDLTSIDAYYLMGGVLNAAAGRISYTLGLQGPCMALDTACSSSLTAIHLACRSLRAGECTLALAGGVNLMLSPELTISMCRNHMLSPDGRCKTFDATANGFVRGEGCGMVVLKRLSDALANRDNILAVVRGSATNQDGFTSGFTVPNKLAQEALIRQALANAGVSPEQVQYVEAHGTGTSLGDPIEMRALAAVFGPNRAGSNPLFVGSVKTNIGHTESSSGVAGFIKTVLALQHGKIPPHLHFNQPSPYIPWSEFPVQVPTRVIEWPSAVGVPIAGVSSFGASGVNTHVVLASAPPRDSAPVEPAEHDRPLRVLTLSARSAPALAALAQRYAAHLADPPGEPLADICFTANTGRAIFAHRAAVVAGAAGDAREALLAVAHSQPHPGAFTGSADGKTQLRVAFLFTGQGAQYAGMARELYATQPAFRRTIDRCDELLRPHLPAPLLSVLYPEPSKADSPAQIDQTVFTQPALFALEYALAELWRAWGIVPSAVMGHSIGEYAAACVAGVFSLEDGLRLVAERGRLMQALPGGGAMAAVFAGIDRVSAAVGPHRDQVSVAAVNGPTNVVISGARSAVEAVLEVLQREGIKSRALTVSHAFHSPLMDPMLDAFERAARQAQFNSPRIPLVSNINGQPIAAGDVPDAVYWRRHARAAVQFAPAMQWLHSQGIDTFVELGPSPTLLGMGRRCLPDDAGTWLPSLREGRSDNQQMLHSLAELYTKGVAVDWASFEPDDARARRRIALPTYPFERERYWFATDARARTPAPPDQDAHPLLGSRVRSAGEEILFEASLSAVAPAFLADHSIRSTPILPASAYIEIALAAATRVLQVPPTACAVDDLILYEPLVLPHDEARTVQVVLSRESADTLTLRVLSLADGQGKNAEPEWRLHASTHLRRVAGGAAEPPRALEDVRTRCQNEIGSAVHYQQLRERGLDFGPAFQGLKTLWRASGEALALGRVELPDTLVADADSHAYHIHPALLDACQQVFASILLEGTDAYVPMGVEHFHLHQSPPVQLWAYVAARVASGASMETLTGDLYLLDDSGSLVAEAIGLSLKRFKRAESSSEEPDQWLYQVVWRPQPLVASNGPLASQSTPGVWMIFADAAGLGHQLAERLGAGGARCLLIHSGTGNEPVPAGEYRLNPADPDGFLSLIRTAAAAGPIQGVIHLWAADCALEEDSTELYLSGMQLPACASVLHLVRALAATDGATPRNGLWLVTRGAQPAGPQTGALALAQSPLWGLGTAIAQELPELKCARVDLDPACAADDVSMLMAELAANSVQDQIAFRGDTRYVARLEHFVAQAQRPIGGRAVERAEPVQLVIAARGVLENLALRPATRRQPGPGEVEIEVHAAGLNFRDVLNALGMYPGDAGPLGGECAGTVVAIGPGVSAFQVGDGVMAVAAGSFRSFVTVRAEFVAHKPETLSFAEAATIPVAFLTAHYALHRLAGMSARDRVLIHAAAGGVGMAAVQLAQADGAEIYGTAGSPLKRAALTALGVQHVMHSRTLDFANEVMAATGGLGVTIVLNSLNGEFIAKNLAAMSANGCFLEIGKLGIWDANQVAQSRPDVNYHVVDLGEASQADAGLIQSMFGELLPAFECGALKPLPLKVFPISNAVDAFRYMAQARHIGKIALTLDDRASATGSPTSSPTAATAARRQPAATSGGVDIAPDGTILLTGAFGGIGLAVASWLVQHGARHLAMLGRHSPTEEARAVVLELERQGAQVVVCQADVSRASELRTALDGIGRQLPPLRGVLHLAGVVDDAALLRQEWARFASVLAPKVAGAWNLHQLTLDHQLDFFVLFSSASTLIASPGQASYMAANAFLDALAHHRHALGLPALSVDWGPWSDLGMTARAVVSERVKDMGFSPMTTPQALQALERVLRAAREPGGAGVAQVGVLQIDWQQFIRQRAGQPVPPFLGDVARGERSRDTHTPAAEQAPRVRQPDIVTRLREAPPTHRRNLLVAFAREHASAVLGLGAAVMIDPQQPLQELGLDSLMAVELRNKLAAGLGQPLPATLLFEYPSLEALADFATRVLQAKVEENGAARKQSQVESAMPTPDIAELAQLSEGEAEALLLLELRKSKGGHQDG